MQMNGSIDYFAMAVLQGDSGGTTRAVESRLSVEQGLSNLTRRLAAAASRRRLGGCTPIRVSTVAHVPGAAIVASTSAWVAGVGSSVVTAVVVWFGRGLLSPVKPGVPHVWVMWRQRQLRRKRDHLRWLQDEQDRWTRSANVGTRVHWLRSNEDGWIGREGRIVDIDHDVAVVRWTTEATAEEAHHVDREDRVSVAELERDALEYERTDARVATGTFYFGQQVPFPGTRKLESLKEQVDNLDLKLYRMRRPRT